MIVQNVFFAGGGTGGHIYPALAVAQQLLTQNPNVNIRFFCSDRKIDADILAKTSFDFIPLPAIGFSPNPLKLLKFLKATRKSYKIAKNLIASSTGTVMVGVGGFVSVGPVMAADSIGIPVMLINTDSVPGKANKFLTRWADEIYVHFESSRKFFSRPEKAIVTGCPLRADFASPDKSRAMRDLGIDPAKKVLLVTGASSGAKTINDAVCLLLDKLCDIAGWQIVHLTGKQEYASVVAKYGTCASKNRVADYYDHMADLFACADLVVGRAGAVSVAEYGAAGVPSICMPYPFHKDNHQKLNAAELESVGGAIVMKDHIDAEKNAGQLWLVLERLMRNPGQLEKMAVSAKQAGRIEAASQIASRILSAYKT
ncbi:MAG: hypothetical protein A2Y12_06735 [Planctomycetes bacterium GWF2_42_9]|nr:MAG: hypothetical protein A2Y12_06735 [Planctomycetes bacterium GWF2_42_9]